jgi:branched-chain amino acid transport system substrate-binding protein
LTLIAALAAILSFIFKIENIDELINTIRNLRSKSKREKLTWRKKPDRYSEKKSFSISKEAFSKIKKYKIVFLSLLLILLLAIASNYVKALLNLKGEVRVGAILSLEGPLEILGEVMKESILDGVSAINKKGGINGKKFKVNFFNVKDTMDTIIAFKEIQHLKYPAIINCMPSGPSMAIDEYLKNSTKDDYKVVIIGTINSRQDLKDSSEYFFKICPDDREYLFGIAYFVSKNYNEIGVLYSNQDFGNENLHLFQNRLRNMNNDVSFMLGYDDNNFDFRSLLKSCERRNPDSIVIIPSNPNVIDIFISQAKELQINTQFISTYPPSITKYTGKKENSENLIYPVIDEYTPDNLTYTQLQLALKLKDYYETPNNYFSSFSRSLTQYAYDASLVLAEAMKKKGLSPEQIKDGLYSLDEYTGITGPIKFDSSGNAIGKLVLIKKIKNGKSIIIDSYIIQERN